jgi:hypothetical protein
VGRVNRRAVRCDGMAHLCVCHRCGSSTSRSCAATGRR